MIHMSRLCEYIIWVDHVSRSYEWSRVEIMWSVSLVTMTLQLPPFLGASSAERESYLLSWLETRWKTSQSYEKDWERKPEENENILAS